MSIDKIKFYDSEGNEIKRDYHLDTRCTLRPCRVGELGGLS
jgi:hypothetical protein